MIVTKQNSRLDLEVSFLIFIIMFTIFVFTSNAHRYSIDEDEAQQLTLHLVTQKPDPNYIQDQSKMEFNYPSMRQWAVGPPCQNGILCYPAYIGHSVVEVPFVFINHYLHIITPDTVTWTYKDFDDPHYVYWRNSIDPDFTFLQLYYGPFFSALSVGVFFLVCRSFEFSQKNSLILSLLYGLTTTVWAYSHTSLNSVAMAFFILLGFLFFRKFQSKKTSLDLVLCGSSIGFAFLIRPDASLFLMPLFFFLLVGLWNQSGKVKKILAYLIPLSISYLISQLINLLRFGTSISSGVSTTASVVSSIGTGGGSLPKGMFGLLLSPGVGLLIFAPILFTIFFSFPDFYKRNRGECLLFLSFTIMFLISFGPQTAWHGLVAWGARYLLPLIPFLVLPMGASMERRKNSIFKVLFPTLGGIGVFVNIVYVIQDVSWFVWTWPASGFGLFGLAAPSDPLYISPATLWTFQYSQLTQSIITAFTHLQPDIFFLKLFGPIGYGLSFGSIMILLALVLWHKIRSLETSFH